MEGTPDGPLPSGVVSLLFTDVEGSTRLWSADSDAMSASLRLHDEILRPSRRADNRRKLDAEVARILD